MVDKIALEVVNHRHRLLKGRLIATAAHQDTFRAEHLRYLGQHRGAAVSDHLIGETPQQRVGGNAGETVRSAALQAELQLAQLARLALVMAHRLIQGAQMLQPCFHFVVVLLAHHILDTVALRQA